LVPSARVTVLAGASTLFTFDLGPKRVFDLGRVSATAIQMPPVPPCAGNRNVALGPQFPAVLWRMTFLVTVLRSGAATRSPSHWHCIFRGRQMGRQRVERGIGRTFVVGTAHTLKLYGLMNRSAIPVPIILTIHSSKSFGFVFATRHSNAASIIPSIHLTWSSFGSIEILFWKGYGTQRFLHRT
jgi:hypothetical protein